MYNLDTLIKIRLSYFRPLFRMVRETGRSYTQQAEINSDLYGLLFFEFTYNGREILARWKDQQGTSREQHISIVWEASNLKQGYSVPYFEIAGRKCRTLYTDGRRIYSRYNLDHYYSRQHRSRKEREIFRAGDDPHRPNGKETYRGELTPYGRRIRKYREDKEREQRACTLAIGEIHRAINLKTLKA